MPEGPELRMNSVFVNNVCHGLFFGGRPIKSSISKNPDIDWDSAKYTITSESRGKEMALLLHCQEKNKSMRILFRFGMSGEFAVTTGADSIPKHAHLQFRTVSEEKKQNTVLSFVDSRRFGSWHVMDGWGEGRGPDIIDEYDQFRANVLDNLKDVIFNKAICEIMLCQKYFNGIGNYLRAEVLFRAKVPPFTCARNVLANCIGEEAMKSVSPPAEDVLSLCRDVIQEVLQLKISLAKAGRMSITVSKLDHAGFLEWLQCYNNPSMNIMKDRIGRSIWFHGPPGPMVPKGAIKAPKRRRIPDHPNPTASRPTTESCEQKVESLQPKKLRVEDKLSEVGDDMGKGGTHQPSTKTRRPRTKKELGSKMKPKQQKNRGEKTASFAGSEREKSQSPSVTARRSVRLRDLRIRNNQDASS